MIDITVIKEKLEKEYLIEYIFDLLNEKDPVYFSQHINDLSGLYNNCIFIDKEEFDNQCDMKIYDEEGDILLNIEPPFIDDYSLQDYLNDDKLLLQLQDKLDILKESEMLILLT